jgi:putative spermidine/putrescine transport system ATP-binding protein
MKDEHVVLKDVTKRFGPVVAVDGVSLEVGRSEFLTLLGPSGSGKTTTLMIIAGFESATSGEVYIDGKPMIQVPAYKRNIGMVFQNYALFPHMTVEENIAYPLKMRKMDRKLIEEKVRRILELLKLPEYSERYPSQLSGGQQQRIALGRALVFDPPLLLMDEPLGALDKQLREHMQLEIKNIQRALKVCVIYVTHDQEEALTISDRIAVYNHGRIEQIGSPEELYEKPDSAFVANFIGESNLFEGCIERIDGELARCTGADFSCQIQTPEGASAGQKLRVVIRPEKIFFIPESGSVNGLTGRIEEVIYVGEMTKYTVKIGGHKIQVKRQNRWGERRYEVGDSASLAWNPQDVRVLL